MFRLISNLVIRHPRAVLLAWLGLIARLALARSAMEPDHQGR